MIEQAIYFALGCIVTALLAMLFAPVFWNRALRLTRQRLQLQVPLSMQEILAERDQLRAEFAVDRLRVEQERDTATAARDRDRAEMGRRSMEAVRVGDEVATLRRLEQAQDREIAALLREAAEREAEAGGLRVELHDAHLLVDRLRSDRDGSKIALSQALRQPSRVDAAEREEAMRAATVLARGDHEAALETNLRLEEELEAARAELAEVRDRQKSFHLGNSLRAEKDRVADRALTERLNALEIENAELRRGSTEARGDPASRQDDAGLRRSIHALGLAVAEMTRRADRGVAPDREPPST